MTWWQGAWQAGAWGTLALWGVGLVWFAACTAVLVRTDLREHRLPNRWTLRLWAGGLAAMGGGAVLAGRWDVLGSVLLGGLGYAAAISFVLFLIILGASLLQARLQRSEGRAGA